MATLTLGPKSIVVLVVLVMTSGAGRGQHYFLSYRNIVATNTLDFLMLTINLEIGFIVVKVPAFPIPGVMTSSTFRSKRAFMDVLLFMA